MQSLFGNPAPSGVVGLVPAAGSGRRIAPLPCSKELFPVGFQTLPGRPLEVRPKVVSQYLLEKFRAAGIANTFIVIREGKWDIPAYFGQGAGIGMSLAYIPIGCSAGPPDTLDQAYPFVRDKVVAFGFPDIVFGPVDVFTRLLNQRVKSGAEIALGLYPAHDCRVMDMVALNEHGYVRDMKLKPLRSRLRYTWLCAVWGPAFTNYLHRFMADCRTGARRSVRGNRRIDAQGDIPLGKVLQAAIREGIVATGVVLRGTYIDIGTPMSLKIALRRASHRRLAGPFIP